MTIFLHELISDNKLTYLPRPNFKKKHYSIRYLHNKLIKEIDFEDFNYEIVNTGNRYKDSAINQPFGLFRLLWRSRGGYSMKINFDKEMDLAEFGPSLACNFYGYFDFTIDDIGNWKCKVDITYIQSENTFTPFPDSYYQKPNSAVLRARKLAKPAWGMDGVGRELQELIQKDIEVKNKTVNLSFNFKDTLEGSWAKRNTSLI